MNDGRIGPLETPVKLYFEVTDTVSIPYTTGIQRVVREVVSRLGGPAYPDLEVIPIFRPASTIDYRTLTDGEQKALANHPAGGAAGRRADKFGPLSPLVRVLGDTKVVYLTRIKYRELRSVLRERRAKSGDLTVGKIPSGSIFVDIEGSWFDPEPRATLLPRLAANGVTRAVFVHDVMPTLFPEWFAKRQVTVFNEWLDSHIRYSQLFLTNSRCTTTDLIRIASDQGIDLTDKVHQIPLGADFITGEPLKVDIPSTISRYLLVVGTIEPRKNHRLVLDSWNQLKATYPDLGLVFVGKEGWMVGDLANEIRSHELFGERLLWLGGLKDSELLWLYKNAFLTIAPSRYEGLGVPVIEALMNGCPAIVSTGGALPEAGEGYTELIDPTDTASLSQLIRNHLDDPEHHMNQVELAKSYVPPTWEQTTVAVAAAIRSEVMRSRSEAVDESNKSL